MLPLYLKVTGFRSYIDTKIDFTSFGNMFCVVGENGAGKSSIIEMITTALYWRNSCTDSKGAGMDECINSNYNYFDLEFCFRMNEINYRIKTGKERNESRYLEFYIDNIDQSEKVSETQNKINNILKMNYDTFLDTVCIGQGMSSRFMSKKPAERKQTLMQILDIQKFEQYESKAKEYKKETKDKLDSLQYKIDFLKKDVFDVDKVIEHISKNELDIIGYEKKIDDKKIEYEKIFKERLEYEANKQKLEEIKQNFERTKNQYYNITTNLDKYNEELLQIESKIKNNDESVYEVLKKTYLDLDEQLKSLRDDITEKKERYAVINHKLYDYEEKYTSFLNYNKAICEFCGNEITEQHKKEHLEKLSNSIAKGKQKKEEIQQIISELSKKGKELTEQRNLILQDIEKTKEEKSKQERIQDKVNSLKKSIKEYEKMLSEIKPQYESMKNLSHEQIEEKHFSDRLIQMEINELYDKVNSLKEDNIRFKQKIEEFNNNQNEVQKLENQINDLKIRHADYTSIVSAFGKSGIPSSIIAHDIPEMEEETNKILKIISNDSMSIQFITTKSTSKNKKTVDTLEIVVNDSNGSRAYETYSGGEKFRIDFACHIGMSKFLTKRSGASIDFLIVDEGLGSQDDFAKQKFIESISSLKSLFKQIMVITHIQDLQNAFDNKVFVQKNQLTGSSVEKVI